MKPGLFWIENTGRGQLAIMPRPRGGDWLEAEVAALKTEGVAVLVSLLTRSEADELDLVRELEICEAHGLTFISFPVEDRALPRSCRAVEDLVRTLRSVLEAGHGVAIHCRMGIGRSALIAACLLMDAGCDAESALAQIRAARGVPVPDTEEQRSWLLEYPRRVRLERAIRTPDDEGLP